MNESEEVDGDGERPHDATRKYMSESGIEKSRGCTACTLSGIFLLQIQRQNVEISWANINAKNMTIIDDVRVSAHTAADFPISLIHHFICF